METEERNKATRNPQVVVYLGPDGHGGDIGRPEWTRWITLVKEKEGKSASQRVRELVRDDLARLEGVKPPVADPPDYASAERSYLKIIADMSKIRAALKKAKVYDRLLALAKSLGLDANTCWNVDEICPKVLERWDGQTEHAHQFVILLKKNKEERRLEALLSSIAKKEKVPQTAAPEVAK